MNIFVSGADQSEYNGLFVVNKDENGNTPDDNVLTYDFIGSPAPPTGDIFVSREIQGTDVIKYNNYFYDIDTIINIDEKNEWLILNCIKRGPHT